MSREPLPLPDDEPAEKPRRSLLWPLLVLLAAGATTAACRPKTPIDAGVIFLFVLVFLGGVYVLRGP